MDLNLGTTLVLVALVAACVLVFDQRDRLWASIAVVAAGVEALLAFKVISVNARGIPLGLLLAAALGVAGILCWMRAGSKTATSAATLIVMVGALQMLLAAKVLG